MKEVSEYLKIPESNIQILVKNKKIPYHQKHGFIRFDQSELDAWMRNPESGFSKSG